MFVAFQKGTFAVPIIRSPFIPIGPGHATSFRRLPNAIHSPVCDGDPTSAHEFVENVVGSFIKNASQDAPFFFADPRGGAEYLPLVKRLIVDAMGSSNETGGWSTTVQCVFSLCI